MDRKINSIVLLAQALGFALVILLLWLDEALDIPHRLLGAPATPLNWRECLAESLLTGILAVVVIVITHRLLARLRYLEGFIHVCSYCRKVREGDQWIPMEVFITKHSEARCSHGMCPDCLKEHFAEFLDKV